MRLLALLPILAVSLPDCDKVVNDASTSFTGVCSNKWHNVKAYVRPAQHDVGYAWVQKKVEEDFGSSSDAQDALDTKTIPAVLGVNNVTQSYAFYAIDGHHTVAALDYSGYHDTHVHLTVVLDLRALDYDVFLEKLTTLALAYELAHPSPDAQSIKIPPQQLPLRFSFTKDDLSFGDDRWRSLAGFSRKVKNDACTDYKYCMRCFMRGCNPDGSSIPFVEYKWSYFFVDALTDESLWPTNDDYEAFKSNYGDLPECKMGKIDTSRWEKAAADLIPLCRGEAAGAFRLPSSLFKGGGPLPGYTRGMVPIAKDPSCNPPGRSSRSSEL